MEYTSNDTNIETIYTQRPITSTRNPVFDKMKGFAMVCVIAGHMGIDNINYFVFSFHMPLFFLISGYFFKNRQGLISKNVRHLLMPYLFTGVCLLLLTSVAGIMRMYIKPSDFDLGNNILRWLAAIAYGSGSRTDFLNFNIPYIGAVWFLLALFWGLLGMKLILTYIPRNTTLQVVTVVVIAITGWLTAKLTWLPLSVQAGCMALVFIYIGWFVKNHEFKSNGDGYLAIAVVVSFIVIVWNYIDGSIFGMVINQIPHGVIDIAGGCTITYLLYITFSKLDNYLGRGMVELLGKYSLVVLCFHLIELTIIPWGLVSRFIPSGFDVLTILIMKIGWVLMWVYITMRMAFLRYIFGIKLPKTELITESFATN